MLKKQLPVNVHLLTLKILEDEGEYKTYLIRLEHQFEASESPWGETASVSLAVSRMTIVEHYGTSLIKWYRGFPHQLLEHFMKFSC